MVEQVDTTNVTSLNAPVYKHFNVDPSQYAERTAFIESVRPQLNEHISSRDPKAELTEKQRDKLQEAEEVTKEYLKEKITSYGFNAEYIDELTVNYVLSVKDHPTAGGYHEAKYGYTAAVVRTNIRETAVAAAHELSHASTKHMIVMYWKGEAKADSFGPSGFEQVTNDGRLIGRGLENGFAILDQLEVVKRLARIFPDEQTKLTIGQLAPKVQESLDEINDSYFGPISREELIPLLMLSEANDIAVPLLLTPTYLFVKELCRVAGYYAYKKNLDMAHYTEAQIIAEGRKILDRTRYDSQTSGKTILEEIFTTEEVELLFNLTDRLQGNGLELFDNAMEAIRSKERQMGILPKVPMVNKPLRWKPRRKKEEKKDNNTQT